MQRRSMEFLMTYGWAAMVVLAALGALSFFGVISQDMFSSKHCFIQEGFECTEFEIEADGPIQLKIRNSLGFDIGETNVTLVGKAPDQDCFSTVVDSDGVFKKGYVNDGMISFSCDPLGQKFRGAIRIDYSINNEKISVDGNLDAEI